MFLGDKQKNNAEKISSSMRFILLMGIVSLFSDMTHEGSSGISGAYLSFLGASAATIGFVSGLGTFIGYGLRILTGLLADKTKKYWLLTILGYAIDVFVIPLLALIPQNGLYFACGLLLAGRIGNAVKKPAKDTMVSFAASQNGVGKSFAILEFVDQIGAFLGPMFLFLVMLLSKGQSQFSQYRLCFAFLGLPAIACVVFLFLSRRKFPHPDSFEKEKSKTEFKAKRTFILYLVAACVFAFGFIDFPLITAHESLGGIPTEYLPLLYAGAMLVDAFAALGFGLLYDKKGFIALIIAVAISMPFSLFIFGIKDIWGMVVGIICWGISMGAQESIMKAAVASMTTKRDRSKSYGIFQTCFGALWFLGSWLLGYLYDLSSKLLIIVSVSVQGLSLVMFILTALSLKWQKRVEAANILHEPADE